LTPVRTTSPPTPRHSYACSSPTPRTDGDGLADPSCIPLKNNVYWRARYDYRRNSIAGLAQHHFAHRDLQGLNTTQQLAKLLNEKGIDWNDCPEWYKFGTLVKRESYILQTTTPKGEAVEAIRTRIMSMPFQLDTFNGENVRTLLCKTLKPDEVKAKEAA
jgi:tRNA(His) guanylyltransferase